MGLHEWTPVLVLERFLAVPHCLPSYPISMVKCFSTSMLIVPSVQCVVACSGLSEHPRPEAFLVTLQFGMHSLIRVDERGADQTVLRRSVGINTSRAHNAMKGFYPQCCMSLLIPSSCIPCPHPHLRPSFSWKSCHALMPLNMHRVSTETPV